MSAKKIFAKEGLYAWFFEDGYFWDWLAVAVLIIITFTVPTSNVHPAVRFYETTDPTINYPGHDSTISSTVLFILVFLFPAVVMIAYALYMRSFHDGHHAFLSGIEAFALASAWKRWMNLVGVYRPMWLHLLNTGDEAEIKSGNLAYPSGHSAYMFCTCTVLSLFLLGKFRILSQPSKGQFFSAFLCLIPMMLSTFVALSRIYDYKHAPADVNAGSFVGIICGFFAYFLNFPSILDLLSHISKARFWTSSGLNLVASVPPDAMSPRKDRRYELKESLSGSGRAVGTIEISKELGSAI